MTNDPNSTPHTLPTGPAPDALVRDAIECTTRLARHQITARTTTGDTFTLLIPNVAAAPDHAPLGHLVMDDAGCLLLLPLEDTRELLAPPEGQPGRNPR